MAQGDLKVFNKGKLALVNGTNDLDTNVFKCMFISNTTVPAVTDANPVKATYTEVSGGNFPIGGAVIAVTLSEFGGTVTFALNTNLSYAANVGNPTNVYYAVLYNDSAVNKDCLLFVEINVAGANGTTGTISLTWAANAFTIT